MKINVHNILADKEVLPKVTIFPVNVFPLSLILHTCPIFPCPSSINDFSLIVTTLLSVLK